MPYEKIRALMDGFCRQNILIVGDLMLDCYITGDADRISPEAPVPVVRVREERYLPGGASNVAWNVRALGAQTMICGLLGCDVAAGQLKTILAQRSIALDGVVELEQLVTTVKSRIMASRQQVVRFDREDETCVTPEIVETLCQRLTELVPRASGVIIEDYGKGVVQQRVVDTVIGLARQHNIPAGFDPKDNHELNMRGITVATPNRREAFLAAGVIDHVQHADPLQDRPLLDAGRILLERWGAELLIITLGAQGMLLFPRANGKPRLAPAQAREVFDVSGAGDTVIAVCLLALAAGAPYEEAAELANVAAGIVVGKLGAASTTPDEILAFMGHAG